jgi:signal transduction histidine kinase
MSEVATCVLHNVGNALNGATVAAGLVRARTAGLAVEDLMLMVETLERERHDLAAFFSAGGRGRHLLAFVRELGEGMAAQRREMLAELAHLDEVIQRLVLMVAAQQSLAGGRGFPEKLSLAMQVDEVLELVRAGPGGKEIDWRREYEPVPPIVVDRHRLIEVLLVLLRNARQSVEGSPRSDRRIVLRVRRSRRGSCVEVEDNGTGIAPENLTRIFSGGFSTKPNGLGFSLHHASNAATELGGVLNGESGGAGQGACFRLELPLTDTAPSIPPAPASARDEALTAT